ncbi:hypothetical protein Dimus_006299 [Dionaea muscipula]
MQTSSSGSLAAEEGPLTAGRRRGAAARRPPKRSRSLGHRRGTAPTGRRRGSLPALLCAAARAEEEAYVLVCSREGRASGARRSPMDTAGVVKKLIVREAIAHWSAVAQDCPLLVWNVVAHMGFRVRCMISTDWLLLARMGVAASCWVGGPILIAFELSTSNGKLKTCHK